jgi:hypothetical protein
MERTPNRQPQIPQIVGPITETLAGAATASSGAVAAQVWLVGPGDLCADCTRRSDCPDQSRCLHLAAVVGEFDPSDAPSQRLPLGTGPLGTLTTGQESLVVERDLESLGVAVPEWLRRSGVGAGALLPLRHGQRGLGALVVLGKSRPSEEQLRALAGAARLGAEAIGNVEAYRALAGERNRLAAKNARLRSGLGLPVEPEPELEPPPPTAPTSAPVAAPSAPASPPPPATPAPAAPSPPAPAPAPLPAAASLAGTGAMLHSERFELPPLRSFAQIQREGILHALERTGWRVSGPHGAAAALGLKPTTLESKMKKLGVRRPRR